MNYLISLYQNGCSYDIQCDRTAGSYIIKTVLLIKIIDIPGRGYL
jgi:hypothetical protein